MQKASLVFHVGLWMTLSGRFSVHDRIPRLGVHRGGRLLFSVLERKIFCTLKYDPFVNHDSTFVKD